MSIDKLSRGMSLTRLEVKKQNPFSWASGNCTTDHAYAHTRVAPSSANGDAIRATPK
jgi:hypothetical protein